MKYARQKRWKERNPKKVWAHASLQSAMRRGLVEKKPCEVCGHDKSEAHHPDYDRPAVVVWLCRRHHKEAHKQEGGAQ